MYRLSRDRDGAIQGFLPPLAHACSSLTVVAFMVLLAAAPRARVGDGDDFALPIIPRLTVGNLSSGLLIVIQSKR
jgi:hypothetical protein